MFLELKPWYSDTVYTDSITNMIELYTAVTQQYSALKGLEDVFYNSQNLHNF